MFTIDNKIDPNQVVNILLDFTTRVENDDDSFNHKQKNVFETISLMTGTELMNLANVIINEKTIKVSTEIDIPELIKKIKNTLHYQNKKLNEKDKLQWLVKNNATNALIFKICPTINEREIKTIRESLNIKMNRGRRKMPDLEDRMSIISKFTTLSKNTTDSFHVYQMLHLEFKNYDLGSIHATVIEDEL